MPHDPAQDQVIELENLACAKFGDLSDAEEKLVRAAAMGAPADCGMTIVQDHYVGSSPAEGHKWPPAREVRASLIQWLCVERSARELVNPKGLDLRGAKIVNALDLSSISIPFQLTLAYCRLTGETNLRNTQVSALNLEGSWVDSIAADGVTVHGNVFIRNGFHAVSEIRLLRAHIDGDLDCTNGQFINPYGENCSGSGKALSVDGAIIGGSVYLESGFYAAGEVSLRGARIGGQLMCLAGRFDNPIRALVPGTGVALDASIASVAGGVFLWNKFQSNGEVKLDSAKIGAVLECAGGEFNSPANPLTGQGGFALSAERAVVDGSINLRDGFHAEGEVRLLGAQIGGDLDCVGGTFHNPPLLGVPSSGHALSAHNTTIKGNAILREGFVCEGEAALSGANIGGILECTGGAFRGELNLETASIKGALIWRRIVNPLTAKLTLIDASTGTLLDDQGSWPSPGNLELEGFEYGRILGETGGVQNRLDWIERQRQFRAQPYRQLAKMMRDEGNASGARKVLVEMERVRRKNEDRRWIARVRGFVLRTTVGYFYDPGPAALKCLATLIVLGALLYYSGYNKRTIVPADKGAYSAFEATGRPPNYYGAFHPFVYSFENTFQLVKMGQADRWQSDPNPRRFISDAGLLRWFRWLQVVLGWFFTTMLVSGFADIVRKD